MINELIEKSKVYQRKENIKILKKEINQKWVEFKIKNFIIKFGFNQYTIDDIKKEILNNDLIATLFIKEPSKQNISENICAEILSKNPRINNFKNYCSNINLFLVNGIITKKRVNGVKSIDYYWETNNKKIYAAQKYTQGSGGAQDNQFNDILNFLENTKNNKENIFIALVNGNYYTKNKMNILKQFESNNVFVSSLDDIDSVLDKIQ